MQERKEQFKAKADQVLEQHMRVEQKLRRLEREERRRMRLKAARDRAKEARIKSQIDEQRAELERRNNEMYNKKIQLLKKSDENRRRLWKEYKKKKLRALRKRFGDEFHQFVRGLIARNTHPVDFQRQVRQAVRKTRARRPPRKERRDALDQSERS